jgi:hypothetical protein
MRTALTQLEKATSRILPARLLPAVTAEAACTEYFYEYRCDYGCCTGCSLNQKRQRRNCRICNGVKSCSTWACTTVNCNTRCPC